MQYVIVSLLLVVVFMLLQQNKQPKKQEEPIRYWAPGHLMSYYYPFHVPLRFRRHHRFHGKRHRRH